MSIHSCEDALGKQSDAARSESKEHPDCQPAGKIRLRIQGCPSPILELGKEYTLNPISGKSYVAKIDARERSQKIRNLWLDAAAFARGKAVLQLLYSENTTAEWLFP
jgi:hypothetical protein